MNNINFIKPIRPQRQEALIRWFKISSALGAFSLTTLLVVSLYHASKLFALKQEHAVEQQKIKEVETDLQKQEGIKKEYSLLNTQQTKISMFQTNPKNPGNYLKELSAIIPADASLSSYKQIHNANIELEGTALQTNSVTSFLNLLNQSAYFQNMQLANLQHHKETNNDLVLLRFIIKGKIRQ